MITATPTARGAGAVPYRVRKKGVQVLLIHRPKYGDWSLPKGHLDRGETYEMAALREVEEETGISGELGNLVGSVGYQVGRGHKLVRYYLLAVNGSPFRPNKEADEGLWLSPKKAMDLSSYRRDRLVIERATRLLDNPKTAKVFLVRHAMAGKRSLWKGADAERPLSGVGRRQAISLTRQILEHPVTRILSSPYTRCEETVLPLGVSLSLPVRRHDALAEGSDPAETLRLMRRLKGHAAVLCSHGDVISKTLELLAADGVKLKGGLEWRKGSIWELDLEKGRVTQGRYHPPP